MDKSQDINKTQKSNTSEVRLLTAPRFSGTEYVSAIYSL